MRLLLTAILSLALLLTAPAEAMAATPVWETVQNAPQTQAAQESISEEHMEVVVREGYIYVTTTRPVTVRVMTILGQLISQKTLPEGTSRLKVASRGIYILKAGTQTHRVTI